jgi:hypothetical protein
MELREDGVLVSDAGAHGIHYIYPDDSVLSVRGLMRQ